MTRAAISSGVLLAAAVLAANSSAWAAQAPAAVDPAHAACARPGTLARLPDGRNLHLRCEGLGSPTVILSAGLGDWSNAWRHVEPRIATLTRACTWDRAGAGFSSGSDLPQTIERTTADLWAALQSASIAAPYVLVGHSCGGLESIAFAGRHPTQHAKSGFGFPVLQQAILSFWSGLMRVAMPQRRLLTVTLAGLLAMVGFPGIGPPTAVQAQSEQDCEDVDCVPDEQAWEDEASAGPESADEFVDESEAEPQETSLAGESEPEAGAGGADFAQAEEEEESASEDAESDNSAATGSAGDARSDQAVAKEPAAPASAPEAAAMAPPAPSPQQAPQSELSSDIGQLLIKHIKEIVPGLDAHVFADSDRLQDLGANSVDRAEILMLMQESLSLNIPRVELFGPKNLGEIIALFKKKLQGA